MTRIALRSAILLKLVAVSSLTTLVGTGALSSAASNVKPSAGDLLGRRPVRESGLVMHSIERGDLDVTMMRTHTFKVSGRHASDARDFVEDAEIAESDWTAHSAPVLALGSKVIGAGYGDEIMDILEDLMDDGSAAPTLNDLLEGLQETLVSSSLRSGEDPTIQVCGGPMVRYIEVYGHEWETEVGVMAPSHLRSSASTCYMSSVAADDDDDHTSTHTNEEGVPLNLALETMEELIEEVLRLDADEIEGHWNAWFPTHGTDDGQNAEELKARIALSFQKWNSPLVVYCDDEDTWPYGVLIYEMTASLSGGTVSDLRDAMEEDDDIDIADAEDWLGDSGVSLDLSSLTIRSASGLETLSGDEADDFLRQCYGESLIDP